jgi:cysteine desulfurase
MAIDFARLGADTMALSAHKLGGPQGIGALVVADSVAQKPLLVGGGQERGWRAGTENVAAIRGFGVASRLAAEDFSAMQALAGWRDEIEARLVRAGAVVFAPGAGRLPNTSCVAMPGVSAETQVMALDLAGVAVSAGSACSSGKIRPSHVLRAMGVAPGLAANAIRISLGWRSERQDIDHLVEAWTALGARTGASHREAAGRPLPAA